MKYGWEGKSMTEERKGSEGEERVSAERKRQVETNEGQKEMMGGVWHREGET